MHELAGDYEVHAIRCAVSSSCLTLLASLSRLPTLPGATSAVLASSDGEACYFQFFFKCI